MMVIRRATAEDGERFYAMLCRLDEETEYMMYEPGERRVKYGPDRLRADIEAASSDLLLAAVDEYYMGKIIE